MHPNGKEKNSQLYTIHGVCNDKVHVPMLCALTNKKAEQVYFIIWSTLNRVMDAISQRSDYGLRAVLDFEKATIRALTRTFPGVLVRGCAFHLARAWNRKRDVSGLRKFVKGENRSRRVVRWWNTIKGIVFLPPRLYNRVSAIRDAPAPQSHPAHDCFHEVFAGYLAVRAVRGPMEQVASDNT